MADAVTVVDRYIDTWNEIDPQRRRAIIAETWADDATYVDPMHVRRRAGRDRHDDRRRPDPVPRPPLRADRRA